MRHVFAIALIVSGLTAPGCAFFAQSHIPYTPMLNRGGQADVSLRTGITYPGGVPIALHAAVAPVDGFEVLANADVNVGTSNSHYGGGLAVGTFVPTDTFRLEFIAGANAGYGTGIGVEPSTLSTGLSYTVTGPYVVPFGQLVLGFETDKLALGAGVRVQGFFAETTSVPSNAMSATLTRGYERLYVEPLITWQYNFDFVRLEITTGFPIVAAGDVGPIDLAIDSAIQWYLAAGVGFQWDAFGEPAPEPIDDQYVAPPAYTPAPTPAPSPGPTAPPAYETPAAPAEPAPGAPAPTEPAPEPAPASPITPAPPPPQ